MNEEVGRFNAEKAHEAIAGWETIGNGREE